MASSLGFIFLVVTAWVLYCRLQRIAQARFIKGYHFPPGIRQKLQKKHPQLQATQVDKVMQGLRDYFCLCHRAKGRMVAMPSQVVDDAWHEFILSTRSYQDFCRRALGRFLHHTPAEAMRSKREAQASIKRAWRLACAHEGINPTRPQALPLLFSLDTQLAIINGFRYQLDCQGGGANGYCASDIGCSSGGCAGGDSSDSGGDSSSCSSDGGCSGGGCGGD